MKPKYRIGEHDHEVTPVAAMDGSALLIDGAEVYAAIESQLGAAQIINIDGKRHQISIVQVGDEIFVHLDGEQWPVRAINPIEAAGGGAASSDVVVAPMPGVVVTLNVKPGDAILAGQALLTIESMKLQTTISAERDATIAEIFYSEADTFDKGSVLVRFESIVD